MPRPLSVFSPHGLVLVYIGRYPEARVRDIAAALSMTERNVQILMRDLEAAGLVEVHRHGRRNHYRVKTRRKVGKESGIPVLVADLLNLASPAIGEDGGKVMHAAGSPASRSAQEPETAGKSRQLDWLGGRG